MSREGKAAGPRVDPEEEKARSICLGALERRMRTRRELRDRMSRRGVSEETAEAVLSRLEAVGLVDDEAYARSFVRSRLGSRPRGDRALAAELWQKGIPGAVAERVLAEAAEADGPEQRARRALAPKLRALAGKPADEIRRKARDFLLRRGFDHETANAALCDLLGETDDSAD